MAISGPNLLQNYPAFETDQTVFDSQTGNLSTRYSVDAVAGANAVYPLTIDFYVADGSGQGMRWIGSDLYEAAEAGQFVSATFVPQAAVGVSDPFVATVTGATGIGATSEFSSPIVVPEPDATLALLIGAAVIAVLGRGRMLGPSENSIRPVIKRHDGRIDDGVRLLRGMRTPRPGRVHASAAGSVRPSRGRDGFATRCSTAAAHEDAVQMSLS